jgi:hypothetical protein
MCAAYRPTHSTNIAKVVPQLPPMPFLLQYAQVLQHGVLTTVSLEDMQV